MLHDWLILAHLQPASKEAICKHRYNISASFTCLLFIHLFILHFAFLFVCIYLIVFSAVGTHISDSSREVLF